MDKKGFSLVEILIYTAIIGIVGALFTNILISVTRVQNRQTSSIEVNQQMNFALSTIKRLIRESSAVEIAAGAPASILKLRVKDSAKDPTNITASAGKITVQQGANPAFDLTTGSVVVNQLSFWKITAYPGRDTVQIDISISYNTENPQQQFTKTLTSMVARANAATFDSDIVPGSDNAYDVGLSGTRWQDLNLSGEAKIDGISGDGTGKAVCVKADGNLGTCSTQPNASGVCTCN
jgi:type II secretory pathway pseudopilin PulG